MAQLFLISKNGIQNFILQIKFESSRNKLN